MVSLPWESQPLWHKALERCRLKSSFAETLGCDLDKMETAHDESYWNPFTSSIAYLSTHTHTALQEKVARLCESSSKDDLVKRLRSVAKVSIESNRWGLLDTCQKIVSLGVLETLIPQGTVLDCVKKEALLIPQKPAQVELLAKSFSYHVKTTSNYLCKVGYYLTQTLSKTYVVDVSHAPRTHFDASSQMIRIRSLLSDVYHVTQSLLSYFVTTFKAALFALSFFSALLGLRYFFDKFKLARPETLNKFFFRNLNSEALENQDKNKTIGRALELYTLETALSARHGDSRCIPFLVGPPGVGKTQLLEGLALKIERGETRFLNHKKILAVNCSSLSHSMPSFEEGEIVTRLESMFNQIKGFEDDFILFFDEAHNLASCDTEGDMKPGCALQALKDKLLTVPVQCVFATTESEYERLIEPDKAFVSRILKIDLKPLSDEETKILLLEKYGMRGDAEIKPDVYQTVIDLGSSSTESNPRKAEKILNFAKNYLNAWTPKLLSVKIEKAMQEYKALEGQAKHAWMSKEGWIHSEEAQELLAKLEEKACDIALLKETVHKQADLIKTIDSLTMTLKFYTARYHDLVHLIAQKKLSSDPQALEKAKKQYVFLKQILIPEIMSMRSRKSLELKDRFDEQIPLCITKELIMSLNAPHGA